MAHTASQAQVGRFGHWLLLYGIVLALASLAILLGSPWIGRKVSFSGNTDSLSPVTVTIGPDQVALPSNVIRFERQRHDGPAERIDLYLTWPGLAGFSKETRPLFSDATHRGSLIYLTLSQSVMSRDMTGRVAPIYSHLFDGDAVPSVAGLTLHRLSAKAGYKDEVLLTAGPSDNPTYAVRCSLPANAALSTDADCQRDVMAGSDLSIQYRFSALRLADWKDIDDAVRGWVNARVRPAQGS